jgi:hypothetical protein
VRETREDLVNRHIIREGGPDDEAQRRERVAHDLEARIGARPAATSLVCHNILKADGEKLAPSLHATSEQLRKELRQDGLEHRLGQRPGKAELLGHNILRGDGCRLAPSL